MTSDEIKQAMWDEKPVKCNGIEYDRISAYTYRALKDIHTGKIKCVFQLELVDSCGISVSIVEAGKVELIR